MFSRRPVSNGGLKECINKKPWFMVAIVLCCSCYSEWPDPFTVDKADHISDMLMSRYYRGLNSH